MKTFARLFVLPFLLVCSFSCSTYKSFYQLSNVQSVQPMSVTANAVIFEDDNCRVSYNFWADEGQMAVMVTNKTDKKLYLDLSESFFVKNGMAIPFYAGRSYTRTVEADKLESVHNHQSFCPVSGYRKSSIAEAKEEQEKSVFHKSKEPSTVPVTVKDVEVIAVPAHLSRMVDELSVPIQADLYHDCALYVYPKDDQKDAKLTFTVDDSPLKFGTRLSYRLADSDAVYELANDFYVSEIQNFQKSDFIKKHRERLSLCTDEHPRAGGMGDKDAYRTVETYVYQKSNAFYLRYMKLATDKYLH